MPSVYGMEISHEKSKPLVNDSEPNKCNSKILTISMYGKKQEQVKSFKYIGLTLTDNANSKYEILIIATAISIMVRLELIRRSREISFKIKFNLYNSLILSILFTALKRELLSKNLRKN